MENNGPDDLSSTIRYQRDDLFNFACYVGRFLLLVWIELPIYFLRKGKRTLAAKCFISEISSYTVIYMLARQNFRATLFVLILPLLVMRIAMMVGNWGQHAFVDEVDPDSDFRSSITLIDVPVSLSSDIHISRQQLTFTTRVIATASTTAGTPRIISTLAVTGVTTLSHL